MAAFVCKIAGCGTKISNPCGHTVCRQHSLCSMRSRIGTYWSRFDCQVCLSMWNIVMGRECQERTSTLEMLKTWVAGFSKNTKGPYIDSETSRSVLFPGARMSAVVDVTSLSNPEEILREAEGAMLSESQELTQQDSDVDSPPLDDDPLSPSEQHDSSPPSPTSVSQVGDYFPSAMMAQMQSLMTAFQESKEELRREREAMREENDRMYQRILSLQSSGTSSSSASASASSLPPLSECPPTARDNPWRPAVSCISEGILHITDTVAFKIDKVDFFPSKGRFSSLLLQVSSRICI